MGRKPRVSFFDEVFVRFRFLVDEFGASEPVATDHLLPFVRYEGSDFEYSVSTDEGSVAVGVRLPRPGTVWVHSVDLSFVVNAAGLGARQSVLRSARTSGALLRSLDSHAAWLRIVHPLVVGVDGAALLERARTELPRPGPKKGDPRASPEA